MRPHIYVSYLACLLTCYFSVSLVNSQQSSGLLSSTTEEVVATTISPPVSTNSSSSPPLPVDSRMNYPKLLEQILIKSQKKTVLTAANKQNKRLDSKKEEAVVTSPSTPQSLTTGVSSIPNTSDLSEDSSLMPTVAPTNITEPTATNNKTEEMGTTSEANQFVEFFMSLVNRVDRYTLIMICAFLSFFLLIIITIWIVYCVCRGCSKLNRKRRKPKRQQELINPAYEFRLLNNGDRPNPNIDFLSDPLTVVVTDGNNNDKKKSPIYKGEATNETPKSWSGDEEKALLEDSRRPEKNEKEANSHLAKQEDTSSTSSGSSLGSLIDKTGKKSLISGTPTKVVNKDVSSSVMITPPPSATITTTSTSTPVGGVGHKFTPSLRDKTKQQISKEVQSSRRSLVEKQMVSSTSRTKSESSSNFELPPHYPSKRRSIVSSTSSINGAGGGGASSSGKTGSVIDFSVVKNQVDDLFEDMAHDKNTSRSSISSINQSHHSINVSVSNIYMEAIREKRERMETEKRARLNQSKIIASPSDVPGISMNPTGHTSGTTTNLTKTYSTGTLESEKSCY